MSSGSAAPARPMRIGEVAELTGLTPRTIRYYEELGLLGSPEPREQGKHRCYTEADVERIRELVKLKGLLGLSLEQLSEVVETVGARADLRLEYFGTQDPERRRELLLAALPHIEKQLELVRARLAELRSLEGEMVAKLASVEERLRALGS